MNLATRNHRRRVCEMARCCMAALEDIAYWDAYGWPAHITRESRTAIARTSAEAAQRAAVLAQRALNCERHGAMEAAA